MLLHEIPKERIVPFFSISEKRAIIAWNAEHRDGRRLLYQNGRLEFRTSFGGYAPINVDGWSEEYSFCVEHREIYPTLSPIEDFSMDMVDL